MNKWVFRVLVLVSLVVFVMLKFTTSEFVCNPSVCQVTSKNIFGITESTVDVDLQSIKYFIAVRDTSGRRSRSSNEYTVYAEVDDGPAYQFFKNSHSFERADATARQLNEAIKNNSKDIYVKF